MNPTDPVHVWSNIIAEHPMRGIQTYTDNSAPENLYFYNNTIVRNGRDGGNDAEEDAGICLGSTGTVASVRIRNNILWENRGGAYSDYWQIFKGTGTITVYEEEHNTLYHSSGTASWYWEGTERALAYMQGTLNYEDDSPAGEVTDPGFTDPDGADNVFGTEDDDYTLNGTHINNGENLSVCFDVTIQEELYTVCYGDGLDPNYTDWTKTPPMVSTLKQGDHGTSERGAYVFTASTPKDITGLELN